MARHTCYSCGRQLIKDSEKEHCRMCYDVFCRRCTTHNYVLSEYGYPTDMPQLVCDCCYDLLGHFPILLTRVDEDAGGMLLMPQQRVWVVGAESTESGSEPEARPGHRGGSTGVSGVSAAQMAAAVNLAGKSKGQLQVENGLELFLLSFRPINPETTITIGSAARVPLRSIIRVSRQQSTVRLHCSNGTIDLTVGTLVTEYGDEPRKYSQQREDAEAPPTSAKRASDESPSSQQPPQQQASSGPLSWFRSKLGGGGASSQQQSGEQSPSMPRTKGSADDNSAVPSSSVDADATAGTPVSPAPPAEPSTSMLVAADMEMDPRAAEMLEAGLSALLSHIRHHFHFRTDVAHMEELAKRTARMEVPTATTEAKSSPRSPRGGR